MTSPRCGDNVCRDHFFLTLVRLWQAEARLVDHYLARVPAIDLEMKTFTFTHEQHLEGGLEPLKAKVRQEELPQVPCSSLLPSLPSSRHQLQEVKEAIVREVGSLSRAQVRVGRGFLSHISSYLHPSIENPGPARDSSSVHRSDRRKLCREA